MRRPPLKRGDLVRLTSTAIAPHQWCSGWNGHPAVVIGGGDQGTVTVHPLILALRLGSTVAVHAFDVLPESVENLTDKQCAALMKWNLIHGR